MKKDILVNFLNWKGLVAIYDHNKGGLIFVDTYKSAVNNRMYRWAYA